MAEINWGLLDPTTPERVANSFAAAQEARQNRLMRQMQMEDVIQARERKNKLAQLMSGATSMEDMFARVPQMAALDPEAARGLLEQKRLMDETARKSKESEFKRRQSMEEADLGMRIGNYLFDAPVYEIADQGEEFDIRPAAFSDIDQPEAIKVTDGAARPQPQLNMERVAQFGLSPEEMNFIGAMAKSDPKGASKMISQLIMFNVKNRGKQGQPSPRMSLEDQMIMVSLGVRDPNQMTQEQAKQFISAKNTGRASGAMRVNVDAGVKQAQETRGKEFGKFAMEATQNAQNSADAANDINMVVEGLRGMGGGPTAQFKAWAGQVFPPDSEWGRMASMSDLAKTVQAKLAPQIRAAGSGATSDFEMQMYMRAIPTLSTTENGRELLAKYANRVAERNQVRAEIVNELEQEGRLPTPALISQRMKARVPDRFFDPADKQFFGKGNAPKPAEQPATKPAASPKAKFLGFE